MAAIFRNVDELIDQSLGIIHVGTSAPHYRHKTAALQLASKPARFDCALLFQAILRQMKANLANSCTRTASRENWRWEKRLHLAEHNKSAEKRCEKAIASRCGENWVNQMPTASGLVDGVSEKHCNIDLVYRNSPWEATLIELKYDDVTPLYAAFEIVKYGLLYALSRELAASFGYSLEEKHVLAAQSIHLRVVAPERDLGIVGEARLRVAGSPRTSKLSNFRTRIG